MVQEFEYKHEVGVVCFYTNKSEGREAHNDNKKVRILSRTPPKNGGKPRYRVEALDKSFAYEVCESELTLT